MWRAPQFDKFDKVWANLPPKHWIWGLLDNRKNKTVCVYHSEYYYCVWIDGLHFTTQFINNFDVNLTSCSYWMMFLLIILLNAS